MYVTKIPMPKPRLIASEHKTRFPLAGQNWSNMAVHHYSVILKAKKKLANAAICYLKG